MPPIPQRDIIPEVNRALDSLRVHQYLEEVAHLKPRVTGEWDYAGKGAFGIFLTTFLSSIRP